MVSLLSQHTEAVNDLSERGVVVFNAATAALEGAQPVAWSQFAQSWDELQVDTYMPAGATYRRRAYGQVLATRTAAGGWLFRPRQASAFTQSRELMPLYGGASRHFSPIPSTILTHVIMSRLLTADLQLIDGVSRADPYVIGLHMIRVGTTHDRSSPPAPEGRHRDGHLYVAMHLVDRSGVDGGESRVYHHCDDDEPFVRTTLTDPLDSILIDDRVVVHEVSAVVPTPLHAPDPDITNPAPRSDMPGRRDMLLVDIDAFSHSDGHDDVDGNTADATDPDEGWQA